MKPTDYSLKKNWPGYLLVLPACIAIVCVSIYPMCYGISLAFQNYVLTHAADPDFQAFVWLDNFLSVFQQPDFIQALGNTAVWTVSNVVVQVTLAILISLQLNKRVRGRSFFRTTALLPWAIPSVIAALTFRFLYDTNVGIINTVLQKLGIISSGISFLGNLETARWAVTIESIWKGTPFVVIFVLAALQSVPEELYESARVDGAGKVHTFFHITLPNIKGPLGIATILTTIGTINNFNAVWLMTQGGPLGTTEILFTYAYKKAFNGYNFGEAAAISVLMFVIIAVLTAVYTKMIEEKEG